MFSEGETNYGIGAGIGLVLAPRVSLPVISVHPRSCIGHFVAKSDVMIIGKKKGSKNHWQKGPLHWQEGPLA